jgi:sialidase-1
LKSEFCPRQKELKTMLSAFIIAAISRSPAFIDVFSKGDGGFVQIRIPSLVVTDRGTLLAFAEGRNTDRSDQGSNKILLRRSSNGGQTWQPIQIVDDKGADSLNNPCAVVERTSGHVFLMYQRLPAGMKESSSSIAPGFDGPNIYSSFLTESRDDGKSWTVPLDITRTVKHAVGATTICSGPGIGIQLTHGAHKGRLVIPFNEGPYNLWNNYAVFSDDRGRTWQAGQNAPGALIKDGLGKTRSQVNEAQLVELSDGSIMLNSRQFAGAKVRKTAVSRDGGNTWSMIADAPQLRDPSCMASILRYSFGSDGQNTILYSGPDAADRRNGTIRASFDDGKTWPISKVLVPGDFAYSVLTKLPDGSVGCLFETNGYKKIVFARFTMEWLRSSTTGPNS